MMEGEEILKVLQHVRRSLCSEPEEGRPAFGEMFHCNQVSERSFDLEGGLIRNIKEVGQIVRRYERNFGSMDIEIASTVGGNWC